MRFHLTLKIPGRGGAATQFLICDHEASTVDALNDLLNENDHIVVTELNTDRATGALYEGDRISLNHADVAKAAPFKPHRIGLKDGA